LWGKKKNRERKRKRRETGGIEPELITITHVSFHSYHPEEGYKNGN